MVLTSAEVEILDRARTELVQVLRKGAEAHGFTYLEPQLVPLCGSVIPSLGPDIHPGSSSARFHPTAVGELKIGMQVLEVLDPAQFDSGATPTASLPPVTGTPATATPPSGTRDPTASPR